MGKIQKESFTVGQNDLKTLIFILRLIVKEELLSVFSKLKMKKARSDL